MCGVYDCKEKPSVLKHLRPFGFITGTDFKWTSNLHMDIKLEAFSYFLSNVQYYAKVFTHLLSSYFASKMGNR